MVKVNLLSTEAKKAPAPLFNFQRITVLLICLSILFFLMGISLRLATVYQKKGLSEVIKQFQEAGALEKKVKDGKQELNKLNEQFYLLDGYLKREIIWSEKLMQLRNLIFKEIWLTNLSFEKSFQKKATPDAGPYNLFLRGSLIAQEKLSAIGTLSKFINLLKEDKAFSTDFQNPVLTESRTEIRNNIEIMTFAVEMPFRKR